LIPDKYLSFSELSSKASKLPSRPAKATRTPKFSEEAGKFFKANSILLLLDHESVYHASMKIELDLKLQPI